MAKANFESNAGDSAMEDARYEQVVNQSAHSESWVNSALFYDWDNADDHREWLNNAPIPEIVEWADGLIDSWK